MSFVLKLIEQGEHITQDFKLRVDDPIKIAKTLSAFANTEGGRMLIGVRDSGVVAGCNVEEECHMIQVASEMYCKPSVNFEIQVWKVDYKSVLEVTISKSNDRPHFVQDNNGAWQAYLRRADKVNKASPVIVKVWQYEMRHNSSEFRYDHFVCKLFSAWRDGRTLRFVQVSRMVNMDFEETEEQSMIREMVRGFAEETLAPTCLDRDKEQRAPIEEWLEFCENTGLQGITIPDKYGGSEVDAVAEAIIVEELARVDPSFSVMYCVHVGLCSMTISLHGNEEQRGRYLPRLAGKEIGAYSLSEAGAGTDAAALGCKAKISEDGRHYLLNGEKMWVTNGSSADIYVLFAKDTDHPDFGVKKHLSLIHI